MGVLPKDQTVSRGYGVTWYPCIIRIAESPARRRTYSWAGTDDGNLQVHARRRQDVEERRRGRARRPAKGTYVTASRHHASAPASAAMSSSTRIAPMTSSPTSSGRTTTGRRGSRSRVISRTTTDRCAWSARIRSTPHLLFAGTEFGAYVSYDRGASTGCGSAAICLPSASTTSRSIRASTIDPRDARPLALDPRRRDAAPSS